MFQIMEAFKSYNLKDAYFPKGSVELMILKALIKLEHDFTKKKSMTSKVKLAIVKLGHQMDHKVYARLYDENKWRQKDNEKEIRQAIGIDKNRYKNKEWLYDIHWYRDIINPKGDPGLQYMPRSFELACECEWSKNEAKNWNQNRKDIGYDFQKLLFSNAKLNLFVCRCHTETEMFDLAHYFRNAVKNFEQLYSASKFLVVCFKDKKLFYLEIIK